MFWNEEIALLEQIEATKMTGSVEKLIEMNEIESKKKEKQKNYC